MLTTILKNTYESDHLDQYDYGQTLRIYGELPSPLEVHFSLTITGGEAVRRMGVEVDGAIEVEIPDEMLRNNGATHDYNIYAFIYIRDETSGETTHRIIIPVKSRPKPGDFLPPGQPEFPEQLIQSIMEERKKAEDARLESEEYAQSARNDAESVTELAENVAIDAEQVAKDSTAVENARKIAEEKAAYIEKNANQIKENKENISELKGDIVNKLDRPATAQVGQIFRVQAIREDGSLVIEAVDMPSAGGTQEDDSWKEEPVLIISIEEECAYIYVDEINGQPFEFESLAGFAIIPVTGNNTNGRMCIGLNKVIPSWEGLVCMNTASSSGNNQKGIFEIKNEFGIWHTSNVSTPQTSWLDMNGYKNEHWDSHGRFNNVETITSFCLVPYSGMLQPGGIIKIYGKPAKGVTA